jgi:hypothetical protein
MCVCVPSGRFLCDLCTNLYISHITHACHMLLPSRPALFNHPHNIRTGAMGGPGCLLCARRGSPSLYQGHIFFTLSSLFYTENGTWPPETRITIYFNINRGTRRDDAIRNAGPWAVYALRFTSHTDLLSKNLFSFVCFQPMIPSSKNSPICFADWHLIL